MILHTVNKTSEPLARCLALVASGDAVLLLEDGVYATLDNDGNRSLWDNCSSDTRVFALGPDLAARGISDKMLPHINEVTWQEFVALSVESDKVVSWG